MRCIVVLRMCLFQSHWLTVPIMSLSVAASSGFGSQTAPPSHTLPDVVNGNLIQFNDNGAWTWYSDERAIVDAKRRMLLIGSDACAAGTGGISRTGNVE